MSEEQKEKLGSIKFSFEVPEVWDAPDFYLAETNAAVFQIITFEQLYMAGVSWAPQDLRGPPPVDWDEAFDALKMYSEKHGDTKVPEQTLFGAGKCFPACDGYFELKLTYPAISTEIVFLSWLPDEKDLGKWCQRQRQVILNCPMSNVATVHAAELMVKHAASNT